MDGTPDAVARSSENATKKPPSLSAANIGSATEAICENEAWALFTFSIGKLTEDSVDEPAFWWLVRII